MSRKRGQQQARELVQQWLANKYDRRFLVLDSVTRGNFNPALATLVLPGAWVRK